MLKAFSTHKSHNQTFLINKKSSNLSHDTPINNRAVSNQNNLGITTIRYLPIAVLNEILLQSKTSNFETWKLNIINHICITILPQLTTKMYKKDGFCCQTEGSPLSFRLSFSQKSITGLWLELKMIYYSVKLWLPSKVLQILLKSLNKIKCRLKRDIKHFKVSLLR